MKKTLILGTLFIVALSCDNEPQYISPPPPVFFTLHSDSYNGNSGLTSPEGLWMVATDDSGNWIDHAYVSGGDFQLNGRLRAGTTFDLHLVYNMGNTYRIETWLDVPSVSEWQLSYDKQHGYPNPPFQDLTFDLAMAHVPDFKGTIVDSRKSWKISGVHGDHTTMWGFQQSDLNSEFRFPKGDNEVIYSDIVDNESLYQRATGFLASDTIAITNLKPMDKSIIMDYADNTYFRAGFYGFRNRDNLNSGLQGFINSERSSPTGVPATKMGYVDGFYTYRTLIDVTIGKRSMSYEKNGGRIEEAVPFTTIDVTYESKHPNVFVATPSMGFDYFEATWSRYDVPVWTIHGPGNGDIQEISYFFQPFPKEIMGETNLNLTLLTYEGISLTQYSQEFEYSDNFPNARQDWKPRKVYAEVWKHVLEE